MSNKSKKTEYINPADSTFYDMIDRAQLEEDDKSTKILRAAFLAGGMPYIQSHDDLDIWQQEQPYIKPIRANFIRSEEKKEYPNLFGLIEENSTLDKFISSFIPRTEPDTLHISGKYFGGTKNPLSDFLAEISHSIQYSKPEEIREFLSIAAGEERRASGEDVYNIEGTMEHDAHSKYQPTLAKSLVDAMKEDYPKYTPRLKPWKENLERYSEIPDEKEKYGGHASLLLKLIKEDSEKTFNSAMYNLWKKIGNKEKEDKWLRKSWGIKD